MIFTSIISNHQILTVTVHDSAQISGQGDATRQTCQYLPLPWERIQLPRPAGSSYHVPPSLPHAAPAPCGEAWRAVERQVPPPGPCLHGLGPLESHHPWNLKTPMRSPRWSLNTSSDAVGASGSLAFGVLGGSSCGAPEPTCWVCWALLHAIGNAKLHLTIPSPPSHPNVPPSRSIRSGAGARCAGCCAGCYAGCCAGRAGHAGRTGHLTSHDCWSLSRWCCCWYSSFGPYRCSSCPCPCPNPCLWGRPSCTLPRHSGESHAAPTCGHSRFELQVSRVLSKLPPPSSCPPDSSAWA
mmetsp:Transcript_43701/g.95016  ORF Transcript_43701/g.95016 Transcript_43701/m.95016 type:complete len:296 (-) Transcript_43701:1089-1976(-)